MIVLNLHRCIRVIIKKWRNFKLQKQKLMFQIFYSVNIKYCIISLKINLTKYATLNSSSFSVNSRWNQVMHQFMSLMLPSFENRKTDIDKSFKKLSSIYLWSELKDMHKNNNLNLLFSLIGEIAILPHLSGNVKNINSLFDLFWEYSLPQQDFSFREYKKP